MVLLILVSVIVCASIKADNNSNLSLATNDQQQNMEVTQIQKNDELKWTWCIKPEYSDLFFVDNDLIAVKGKNEKYAIINTKGDTVTPFEYLSVSSFEDGFALVSNNKNTFFINRNGKNIFNKVYDEADGFSDGLAAVRKDGLWGFIDESGNLVIKNQFEQAKSFNESFAAVEKNNKWGVIDKSGRVIIDFQYDCINDFQEEIVAIEKDGKWGFINKLGEIIADFQFDEIKNFSEGLAAVMKNDKWGFIDKEGRTIITLKYDEVGNFSEGKASVKLSNYEDGLDEWAYIDSCDNTVIDFYPYDTVGDQIFSVGEFNNGFAFVSKSLLSIIDNKGNNLFLGSNSEFFISSLSYSSKYNVIPAYIYVDDAMKIKKYGLMSLTGNQRLEPIFDYISGVYGDYVIVESIIDGENKIGLIKIYE